jgi:hypothetical protein
MSNKSNSKESKNRSYLEPNAYDRRVRDRNLAAGSIDTKSLEKYLGELADVGDRADTVTIHQPGLGSGGSSTGANGAS